MIPDNGDIVQATEGGFLIFSTVQGDEFLHIYMVLKMLILLYQFSVEKILLRLRL